MSAPEAGQPITSEGLTTTAPWWLSRKAHAARQHKLVVWNPAALAPQVDKIMQEQCYAYAKQAGIKENEIDYQIIGSGQLLPKVVASLEAGSPPDITLPKVYRSPATPSSPNHPARETRKPVITSSMISSAPCS